MKILMTGGTGFLGKELVEILAPHCEKLYLLCRRPSRRLEAEYSKFSSVVLVKGDISSPDIIEDTGLSREIRETVDTIFHGAAYYDIEGPYSSCFMYNVVGTQNVLYLANQCEELKHIHYVSTIAVAGNYSGVFNEDQLNEGQKFNNHYAKTKYDAELMVRSYKFAGSIQIYRLGILIGNSRSGKMSKVDGPYYFFKLLNKVQKEKTKINLLKYLPLPYDDKATMPLMPVDNAAEILKEGVLVPKADGVNCYHVIAKDPPLVRSFVESSLKTFGLNLALIPLPKSPVYKFILPKIGLPSELLLYMYGACVYDTSALQRDFEKTQISTYGEYSDAFYSYARRMFE